VTERLAEQARRSLTRPAVGSGRAVQRLPR
jgi:hypothetical protein